MKIPHLDLRETQRETEKRDRGWGVVSLDRSGEHTPIIPALGRWGQENQGLETSFRCIVCTTEDARSVPAQLGGSQPLVTLAPARLSALFRPPCALHAHAQTTIFKKKKVFSLWTMKEQAQGRSLLLPLDSERLQSSGITLTPQNTRCSDLRHQPALAHLLRAKPSWEPRASPQVPPSFSAIG